MCAIDCTDHVDEAGRSKKANSTKAVSPLSIYETLASSFEKI
jgi:hypothetical protein